MQIILNGKPAPASPNDSPDDHRVLLAEYLVNRLGWRVVCRTASVFSIAK